MTEFIPQTTNTRNSVGDAQILADVLCKDFKPGTLLDIGCGEGLVAISVAGRRNNVSVLGIEIDAVRCATAQDRVERAEITNRVQIICADIFKTQLPNSDAICCNPPLLPDEQGFFVDGTPGNLFWKSLIEKVGNEQASQFIYLHLFDFHGINHRTGELPCLEEVARTTGFSIVTLYSGVRQIGENSRIRYNLPQLVNYFPEGTVMVDDSEVPIYRFSSSYTNTVSNLYIYQSIIRLSR